jgi:hypothetical protein
MPSYNIGVPSPVDLKGGVAHSCKHLPGRHDVIGIDWDADERSSDQDADDQQSDEEEDSDDDHELPDVPLKTAENDSAAAQLAVTQLRKAKEEEARRRTFSELAGATQLLYNKIAAKATALTS